MSEHDDFDSILGVAEVDNLRPTNPITYGDYLSRYGDLVEDSAARTKFIKLCVRQCRVSPEYSRYRSYLLDNLNLDTCSILKNVKASDLTGTLEIHHYPFTLYDIVDLVLSKMIADEESISSFRIANKVMEYHWRGMVGLVPLSTTMHEAAHSSQIKLHPKMIYGDWLSFIAIHLDYLNEDIEARLHMEKKGWERICVDGMDLSSIEIEISSWNTFLVPISNLIGVKEDDELQSVG